MYKIFKENALKKNIIKIKIEKSKGFGIRNVGFFLKAVALNARIVHVNGLRKTYTAKKKEDSRCLHIQFVFSQKL